MFKVATVLSALAGSSLGLLNNNCLRGLYKLWYSGFEYQGSIEIMACEGVKYDNMTSEMGYYYSCDTVGSTTYVKMVNFATDWKCETGGVLGQTIGEVVTSYPNASDAMNFYLYFLEEDINCNSGIGNAGSYDECYLRVNAFYPIQDAGAYTDCVLETAETRRVKSVYPVGYCTYGVYYSCGENEDYYVDYYLDDDCATNSHVAQDHYTSDCNLVIARDDNGIQYDSYYQRLRVPDCGACTISSVFALLFAAVAAVLAH
jgi:hypothetical protein